MKIQLFYILNCSYCLKTERLIKESLKELKVDADLEKVLIDNDKKAKKFKFVGSPTVRINQKDIQTLIRKERCLPCEEISKKRTKFIKKEVKCGCRIYFYKGKKYPFPPKEMIKDAIRKYIKK